MTPGIFATKDQIRAGLLGIHEQVRFYPELGGYILLREFTARERRAANEAVVAQDADNPDQILFQAMLIQRCLVDPNTGTPYSDGRLGKDTSPLIDPRTRTPVFTVAEVQNMAEGRANVFNRLWDDLMDIAALGPQAMFSGSPTADSPERDAGTGDPESPDPVGEAADLRPGDADERGALVDQPIEGTGDPPPANA